MTPRLPLFAIVALFSLGLVGTLVAGGTPPDKDREAKLIAVLKSDAPLKDKADACRELSLVGTKESVAPLAAMLGDEKLSHLARYGLEPIPDPAVDEALRGALGKLKGRLLDRRDRQPRGPARHQGGRAAFGIAQGRRFRRRPGRSASAGPDRRRGRSRSTRRSPRPGFAGTRLGRLGRPVSMCRSPGGAGKDQRSARDLRKAESPRFASAQVRASAARKARFLGIEAAAGL